jgi:hypothetical protein
MEVRGAQRLHLEMRIADRSALIGSVVLVGRNVSIFAAGGRSVPMRLEGGRS